MERPVGMALQPLADLGRPVGRDVVENDVHRGSGVDPLRTPFRDPFEGPALPARPPLSRFAGCSRRRREDNVTLSKETELLVLSQTLAFLIALVKSPTVVDGRPYGCPCSFRRRLNFSARSSASSTSAIKFWNIVFPDSLLQTIL